MNREEIQTFLAQLGTFMNPQPGSMSPGIYTSTAYEYEIDAEEVPIMYTRSKNPTRDILQAAIAKIENGSHGYATPAGMAAVSLVINGLLSGGDKLVAFSDVYGGTFGFFKDLHEKEKYDIVFASTEEDLINSIDEDTKLVYFETPTNPMMTTIDISKVSEAAKKVGAYTVVDNTFFTPLNQQPLSEGADVVLHSATKYIAGHHDVLAGLVACDDEDIHEKLDFHQKEYGLVLSPFDCWLTLRGMKTMAVRMRVHEENAEKIVDFLKKQKMVNQVFYPGKSGVLSCELSDKNKVYDFVKSLKSIGFAVSLGGTETTITYPIESTHKLIPDEIREGYGLTPSILRITVGLEDSNTLISDLEQALNSVK